MIAQGIVILIIGWCAGMATAYLLSQRAGARGRQPRLIVHDAANPLRDPEVLDALKRQIARWEAAAAHE